MSQFISSRIDSISGFGEGFAVAAPAEEPLEVVRLWHADFSPVNFKSAYVDALEMRDREKRLVFAQLADEQFLTLDELRYLADNDFAVVSVSSVHRKEGEVTDELVEEVREGLQYLTAGAAHLPAPGVDREAARRVEEANRNMSPLSRQEIEDFLAGHYRLGGSDDGTR